MSCRQSNVVTKASEPSAGSGSLPRVVERGVGQAAGRQALRRPVEGVPRDVVPGEAAGGERPGQAQHAGAGPAPDVGGGGAGRQRARPPRRAGAAGRRPGGCASTARSRARPRLRRLGPERVVVVADAGAEALGQGVEQRPMLCGSWWNMPSRFISCVSSTSTGTAAGAARTARRGHPCRRRSARRLPGCRPTRAPTARTRPCRGQLAAWSAVRRRRRGPEQAQAVAEVDHGCGHRPPSGSATVRAKTPTSRVGPAAGSGRAVVTRRRYDAGADLGSWNSAGGPGHSGLRYSFVTFDAERDSRTTFPDPDPQRGSGRRTGGRAASPSLAPVRPPRSGAARDRGGQPASTARATRSVPNAVRMARYSRPVAAMTAE